MIPMMMKFGKVAVVQIVTKGDDPRKKKEL